MGASWARFRNVINALLCTRKFNCEFGKDMTFLQIYIYVAEINRNFNSKLPTVYYQRLYKLLSVIRAKLLKLIL